MLSDSSNYKKKKVALAMIGGLSIAATSLAARSDGSHFDFRSPTIEPESRFDIQHLYSGFGCTGDNISPPLEWFHPPEETQSFAITLYDPDAPTGSGWWHWQVFNLPANSRSLEAGAGSMHSPLMPASAQQGRNDYGSHAYGGACPPAGDQPHRYQFTLFALDQPSLDIPADASAALIGFMLNAHAIDKASFTLYYSR
ncbi:YbhB/YbcL family Raf kinase inhibitor-like protein [Oceanobacter sp. 4_MG-2023]|uniref:YbhB/YbcL family Raf kinase inhibitor-like protein n=1 Tax=Oceanobacter sp. 4_MG-2023 TaxID=3062623 RepID=UPI002736CCC0|nr:YbhB/YbcL family Raf kinase inhibitor-like protein [Oceanobacter sp. 4_MG-2023]MDP2548330.1 YbhB/YbcL family Raf kinase inhibitor-like protein [Oceanobacter sp. 4_MG-2023]